MYCSKENTASYCLSSKTMKETMKKQTVKREKKSKKTKQKKNKNKKEYVRGHSFMTSAKKV